MLIPDDDTIADLGDGPILDLGDIIPTISDPRSQIGDNHSAAALTDLVSIHIPLNKKQRIIVEKLLSEALAWKNHPYDASKRNQLLLYIGGGGGEGKTRIVRAIFAALKRSDEITVMAPTGTAAQGTLLMGRIVRD